MAKLSDYKDLENVPPMSQEEMRALVESLPESHWVDVAQMMVANYKKFEAERKSITPTYEDMHRRFDI
jgi:hypothetical protein